LSISSFQEKFIKGGCGKFVLLFCGAAMFIGVGLSNCSRGQKLQALDAKGNKEKIFATVGDVELPLSMVDQAVDKQMQQSQLPPDILATLPPEYRIQAVAGGVTQSIQTAQIYEIAKRMGYKPDDENIKKTLHFTSESDFENNLLAQVKKSGQLKDNATIKDLEEFAKPQLQGKTIKDIYTAQLSEVEKILKDPQKKIELVLGGGQQFLLEKYSEGINPTDDEVKKGFENYEIKRIVTKAATPAGDADAKAKADKAYADLKAGKSFEDVMDSSSEETPSDPKKKKSENVLNLSQDMVEKLPDFKAVLTLQPGTYSEPQKVTEGYAIIKYVRKKVDIPKDYESKKAQYKQQNISQQVTKKFKTEMDKIEKDVKPNFEVKAYEAAYRYQKAMALTPGPAQETEFKAIFDLAKGVSSSDEKPDVAAMLQVITIQHLYDQPGADKIKLKADRIAALENYLTFSDNWAYRKEVIDSYKEKGDKVKTFDQLVTALDKNTKFDAQGQTTYSDISAQFLEIKTAGLVTADQEKQFHDKQTQWQSDKKKYDDQVAADKKLKDEEDKKAAAEAKKNSPNPSSTPPKKPTGK
jgi:parvulin-like peptidyl-prolyl isomerase